MGTRRVTWCCGTRTCAAASVPSTPPPILSAAAGAEAGGRGGAGVVGMVLIAQSAQRCTAPALPPSLPLPQGDKKAKLQKIRLQAADQIEMVANTLLPHDLSAPHVKCGTEQYSVNHEMVSYGT